MAKKQPTPGTTTPTQFRLGKETLAAIERIAARLTEINGVPASKADAVRHAVFHADPAKKKARK